jgi:hypothetical protein
MSDTYSIASKRIDEFESTMRAHFEAMDCRDCEDHLLLGIEAFRWVESAQHGAARAMAANGFSQQLYDAITALYRRWLQPCASTIEWAESHRENNYDVRFLAEFKRCCTRASAYLGAVEHEQLSGAPIDLSVNNAEAFRSFPEKRT